MNEWKDKTKEERGKSRWMIIIIIRRRRSKNENNFKYL